MAGDWGGLYSWSPSTACVGHHPAKTSLIKIPITFIFIIDCSRRLHIDHVVSGGRTVNFLGTHVAGEDEGKGRGGVAVGEDDTQTVLEKLFPTGSDCFLTYPVGHYLILTKLMRRGTCFFESLPHLFSSRVGFTSIPIRYKVYQK